MEYRSDIGMHRLVLDDDTFDALYDMLVTLRSIDEAEFDEAGLDKEATVDKVFATVSAQRSNRVPGPSDPTVTLMQALQDATPEQIITAVLDEDRHIQDCLWEGLKESGWVADPIRPDEITNMVGAELTNHGFDRRYTKRALLAMGDRLQADVWRIAATSTWETTTSEVRRTVKENVTDYLTHPEIRSMLHFANARPVQDALSLDRQLSELAGLQMVQSDEYRQCCNRLADQLKKLASKELDAFLQCPELSTTTVHLVEQVWPGLHENPRLITVNQYWAPPTTAERTRRHESLDATRNRINAATRSSTHTQPEHARHPMPQLTPARLI